MLNPDCEFVVRTESGYLTGAGFDAALPGSGGLEPEDQAYGTPSRAYRFPSATAAAAWLDAQHVNGTVEPWSDLTQDERAAVTAEAREDARLFVEEFREPLDPACIDWDAEAWGASDIALRLRRDGRDLGAAWNVYQAELVAETERLCEVATAAACADNAALSAGLRQSEALVAELRQEIDQGGS